MESLNVAIPMSVQLPKLIEIPAAANKRYYLKSSCFPIGSHSEHWQGQVPLFKIGRLNMDL